jgi:hypothetical protein
MERAHSSSDETQRFRSGMRNAARRLGGTAFLAMIAVQVAFAPPARALGPSGLVSPDHIIAGSGDCFYVAHTPSGCGGWEIVRYFSDGSRDTDFHCASPDSCDTGAGGAGLARTAARREELPGRVRGEAYDGVNNSLFLLQDDGIHTFNPETGASSAPKIDLPTAGEGFATPPKSMATAGSGASRKFFVVDANGAVWQRMIGALGPWEKFIDGPAPLSPDKGGSPDNFRNLRVKTIKSGADEFLYPYMVCVSPDSGTNKSIVHFADKNMSGAFWVTDVDAQTGTSYCGITHDPSGYSYITDVQNNKILKKYTTPKSALSSIVDTSTRCDSIVYHPTSGRLLVAGTGDGKIYQYSTTGTLIPWGASPTPTPIPTPTSTPAPTQTPTPTPYSPPVDPPPLDPDQKALLEAMKILGISGVDLQILFVLLNDPNAVTPGGQDLLKDAYALVDYLGKLSLEANPGLVSRIEDGSLSQETFDKALYTLAVYLQETLASPKTARGTGTTPLAETRCRGSVVEMTLKPGVSQGSFTTTFPEGTHEGEDGWRTQYLALLLNRGTKMWERVLVIADSGATNAREGVAVPAKSVERAVAITVTDGLSYDWNETAGVVRVAMTVMAIEIPDGATAPTPRPGDTGGRGCSVVWPFEALLLIPLLFVGPRR